MGDSGIRHASELKQRAAELYNASGATFAAVARGLGIDDGTLSKWVGFEFIDGHRGVSASRKRVARLMRESGMRGVTRACVKRPTGEKRASNQDSHEDLAARVPWRRRKLDATGMT